MRNNKDSIILVELKQPHLGMAKWAFGSKRAIYRQLPKEVLGISYTTLLCKHNLQQPFENDKCIITRLALHRTATQRGRQV